MNQPNDDLDKIWNEWLAKAKQEEAEKYIAPLIPAWRRFVSDIFYGIGDKSEKIAMWANRKGSNVRWDWDWRI